MTHLNLLASRWSNFGTSVFTEMTRLSNENQAINLAQGFPDFPGPKKLLDLVQSAVATCHNQYAISAGEPTLRNQLAKLAKNQYDLVYDPNSEITVTTGASEAIYCIINAVVNPGDRVLMFEPFFDCYAQAISNAGGKIVPIRLHAPDTPVGLESGGNWAVDWSEFATAVATPFKLLILNTPHNPTGKVFGRGELEIIAQAINKQDAYAMCDEVYEHLVFENTEHVSLAEIPAARARTFRVGSAAKSFGFTGFKVGWVYAPPELTHALRLVHQGTVFCTNPHVQQAIASLLEDEIWVNTYFKEHKESYNQKRLLLKEQLEKAGFTVAPSEGSYFLQANYSALNANLNDIDFAKQMIVKVGVAAIPPSVFYVTPPKHLPWLRFAFCKKEETLLEAGKRLAKLN